MELKKVLYDFCKKNHIEEFNCIIHIALFNSVINFSNSQKYVNLSPKVINNLTGIGEDKSYNLLYEFSENSKIVKKYYLFNCCENTNEYAGSCMEEEIEDSNEIEIEGCISCDSNHIYTSAEIKNISFTVDKDRFLDELKISNNDIVVFNTNEKHMEKLADVLVLNIQENKDEAKKGILKYLYSIKNFSSIIADISGDTAKITGNIKKVAEDVSGFSSLKDLLK